MTPHPDRPAGTALSAEDWPAVAQRLHQRYHGSVNPETIERLLRECYDQLAATATIHTWLPLLAERFARQRLTAVTRLQTPTGADTRPTVLFLCVHNAGRSQMALGFFQQLAGDRAIGWSAGSDPAGLVNPAVVDAMAEVGIDITGEFPKPWTDDVVRAADVVISMGCGDSCPVYPGKHYQEWTVADPAGMPVEQIRPIRDTIEQRVRILLQQLLPVSV
jgi:arsenate reductase